MLLRIPLTFLTLPLIGSHRSFSFDESLDRELQDVFRQDASTSVFTNNLFFIKFTSDSLDVTFQSRRVELNMYRLNKGGS